MPHPTCSPGELKSLRYDSRRLSHLRAFVLAVSKERSWHGFLFQTFQHDGGEERKFGFLNGRSDFGFVGKMSLEFWSRIGWIE